MAPAARHKQNEKKKSISRIDHTKKKNEKEPLLNDVVPVTSADSTRIASNNDDHHDSNRRIFINVREHNREK